MAIIYKTTCLLNGKIYVGQHYTDAYDGYIGSGSIFKQAVKQYGKINFIRETLESCDSAIIDEREIYWIDLLKSRDSNIGYNLAIGGAPSTLGIKHSEETRLKMSESQTGDKNHFFGKHHSEETKKKISKTRKSKGIYPSEETRLKMSESLKGNKYRLGIPNSEETRKKISESNKGRPGSERRRQATIEYNKNRVLSDETRRKLREANKGRIPWNKGKRFPKTIVTELNNIVNSANNLSLPNIIPNQFESNECSPIVNKSVCEVAA